MSALRGALGVAAGAAAAAIGLRVHAVARERSASVGEVVTDLPKILADDVRTVSQAARDAVGDGRVAAGRARDEFDEQVVAHARRMRGEDV